ncbi:endo alpha-1,4 polygalactosaminidase [Sulfurimonas sp.]|uniref:endo alpha-1,4 polygalactosaminidase n=1 Tax=Sulfurimonas sp. TaxID=2022749 RepID=UPI003D0D2314
MKRSLLLCSLLVFVGCGGGSSSSNEQNVTSWYKPDLNTSGQIQLQGEITTYSGVELYDIDLFDTNITFIQSLHSDGKKVICYFSAGSYENWRSDKDDFPSEVLGNNLDGWPGEKWLDISNDALEPIIQARLDLAVAKGCDGVDPDNVDGYTNNTGFALSAQDQLNYNMFLATEAHKRGLSIGLKNDLNQIENLEEYFDFSVNEQCHEYDECAMLSPFIDANKPVFNIEYDDKYVNNTNSARDTLCTDAQSLGLQTLILPLDLDGSFRYSCDE